MITLAFGLASQAQAKKKKNKSRSAALGRASDEITLVGGEKGEEGLYQLAVDEPSPFHGLTCVCGKVCGGGCYQL